MSGHSVDDEFIECDSCRAKPGSPCLCEVCLVRRESFYLRRNVKELEGKLSNAEATIATLRNDISERCNERNAFRIQMEAYREVALAHAGIKP